MSRDVTERLAFAVAKRLRSAVSARAHRERLVTSSMVTLETLTMRQIAALYIFGDSSRIFVQPSE